MMPSSDSGTEPIPSSSPTRVNSISCQLHTSAATEPPIIDAEKGLDKRTVNHLPVPTSGFHELGVVFEDVSVYGSNSSRREVESFEISALKAFDLYGLIKRIFGIKSGPSRALISESSDAGQTPQLTTFRWDQRSLLSGAEHTGARAARGWLFNFT
jgi:ATP-binding cassette subfamily G (WHITE) protein 2 (SNQ2)